MRKTSQIMLKRERRGFCGKSGAHSFDLRIYLLSNDLIHHMNE